MHLAQYKIREIFVFCPVHLLYISDPDPTARLSTDGICLSLQDNPAPSVVVETLNASTLSIRILLFFCEKNLQKTCL